MRGRGRDEVALGPGAGEPASLSSSAVSAYAKKNLMEVENQAQDPGREMRFARKYLDSAELGVSYEAFPPGFTSTDGHRHEVQEEAYVVIEGSGRIRLDDDVVELEKWDVVRVAPHVDRGFEAGAEGLVLIAVGGSKPEGGDGSLAKDRWPARPAR
jgi:quercetin dioxygenase-like cupin family protein